MIKAGAYHTAGCFHSFSFAIKLVAEALDVIQTIGDDDGISTQRPLDGGVLGSSGLFFGAGFPVDISRDTKALIVDGKDCKAGYVWIGRGLDLGVEVGDELGGSVGFPRGWVAGDEDELIWISKSFCFVDTMDCIPASL